MEKQQTPLPCLAERIDYMAANFDLTAYLNQGADQLVQDILKTTLRNPKETVFLHRYHAAQRGMEKHRMALEAEGRHIPMFLIASITNACNLFCKGCYARACGQCGQTCTEPLLDEKHWGEFRFDFKMERDCPHMTAGYQYSAGSLIWRRRTINTIEVHAIKHFHPVINLSRGRCIC